MRLNLIKLAGFKSFVEPTVVYFPSNMCGVVGPNGCGKSNIIDAVRWVMGESSAKYLRGESMTDVIFKGSSTRNPSAKASVELVFDNSEGRLVGEYSAFNEISIKRLLTSEAKNIYYLNGTKCRRRDVMDIFLGTGLGPRSYAIISQGIISNLVESKPEELRVFIEEAAGISKYKERRRETENRLHRTNENLERLSDLRDELESRLTHLQSQASIAKRYTALKQEERVKKAQLLALKWRSVDGLAQAKQTKITKLELQIEHLVTQRQTITTQLEQERQIHIELTDLFQQYQTTFYGTSNEITRLEQTLLLKKDRAQELQQDLQKIDESWLEVNKQLELDKQKLQLLQNEKVELEPEVEILDAIQVNSDDELLDIESTMSQLQIKWEQLTQQLYGSRQTVEIEKTKIQQSEQAIIRLTERVKKNQDELSVLEKNISIEFYNELLAQEVENKQLIESEQLKQDNLRVSLEYYRKEVISCIEYRDNIRSQLSQTDGRLTSLEVLQKVAMNQDTDIADWMKTKQLSDNDQLIKRIKVEQHWQLAVETVLGDKLQALCVAKIDEMLESLSVIKQGKVMLVNLSVKSLVNRSIGQLATLESKVMVGGHLLPMLEGVYVCDSIKQALVWKSTLKQNESIVTPEGVWLSDGWIRVNYNIDEKNNILERQSEIDELQITRNNLQKKSQEISLKLEKQIEQRDNIEQEQQLVHTLITELQNKNIEFNNKLQNEKIELEKCTERRIHLQESLADYSEQLVMQKEHNYESCLKLEESNDIMKQDEILKEEFKKKVDSCRLEMDKVRIKIRLNQEKKHQLALKLQNIDNQLTSLELAIKRLAQQSSVLQERKIEIQESLQQSDSPEAELKEQLEFLLNEYQKDEQDMNSVKEKLSIVEKNLKKYDQDRSELEENIHNQRSQLEKMRLDWQSMQMKRTTFAEQLKEKQFDLVSVLDSLPNNSIESDWELDIAQLKETIMGLGAINLAAIDEYQVQQERKEYLDKQYDDLILALKILGQAIKKIDLETRQRFKNTFDRVNLGLQDLFPKMFGGGNAYLQLIGEDLLDTGVSIMAQPPGKKNSTIYLLSGGEKALTAIALVFAIFQLNPSPFCMLDEVDAPLDDANVGRYINMVKIMSEQVQFIYITHNKIAMEAASQLIGVTMQEAGVSRSVSVDMDSAMSIVEL